MAEPVWRNVIEVIAIDVLANPFTTGIRIGKGAISKIYDYVLQLFFRQGIFTPTRAFLIALLFPFGKYFKPYSFHQLCRLSAVDAPAADFYFYGRMKHSFAT